MRYSPAEFVVVTRFSDDPKAWAITVAPATRAPSVSLTVPTRAPCGVWAAPIVIEKINAQTMPVTTRSRIDILEVIGFS